MVMGKSCSGFSPNQVQDQFSNFDQVKNNISFIAPWFSLKKKLSATYLALAIPLGLSLTPAAQAYTAVNSFNYGSHFYTAYSNSSDITWSEARNYALSVGGDLVSLNTLAENTAVSAQIGYLNFPSLWKLLPFPNSNSDYVGPYIGLFQPNGSDGTTGWQWVDNTTLDYTSWSGGEPNNDGNLENVALYFNKTSLWADVYDCATISSPCSSSGPTVNRFLAQSFVAEFIPVPAPAPIIGAMAALGWARRLRRRIQAN